MPNPQPGESKDDFVKRCIPIVIDDGTAKDGAQAFAICTNMYAGKKEIIEHEGAMVALPVPEAFHLTQDLSFPEGSDVLPIDEMHVTLAFLGDVTDEKIDPEKLFTVVEKFTKSQAPVIGSINGYGIFKETHLDDKECLWLSLDAPALPKLREDLLKVLIQGGFNPATNHGFTPHITVAYYPKGYSIPPLDFEPISVMIPALRVAWSELVRDFPFGVITMKAKILKDGLPASAFLVVDDPEKVTTWHLPVRDASGKPDHRLMGAAHAALLSPSGYRGSKYEGPSKGAAIDKLKKMYEGEGMAWTGKGFRVFKQADGSYRWVTISSSAFRDRDGEVITQKALAEDVERCDTVKEYGPLRWWHIGGWEAPDGLENWQTWKATSGVDLGTCDFNMLHGKMLIESGTFKNPSIGKAFSECQENLEVSIAFSHPPDEPGKKKEFEHIHRFERSLLPDGMASNLLTKFLVQKGESTMKIREKLAQLASILKGNLAQDVLANAEDLQKAAEEAGLEFKEIETEEVPTETAPPVTEGEPEVKPEDGAQPITATAPDEAPLAEVPAPEMKQEAAPPSPPAPPAEPQTIGSMTPQQLADFIVKVVQQVGKKEAEMAEVAKSTNDRLDDLAKSFQALSEQFLAHKETIAELTDSRPVGIKRLQQMRPSERDDNVTKKAAPAGPRIDPDFMKFSSGGK